MAQFASGSFTGSNGTTLSTHDAAWTLHTSYTGTAQIASDRIRPTSTTVPSMYWHSGTPASADYSVSADFFAKTTDGGSAYHAVAGRVSTSANTMYIARYGGGIDDAWALFRGVAGAFTQIGSASSQSLTDETSYNVKLEMIGTTAVDGSTALKVYVSGSGTPTISNTDSTGGALDAAGKAGVRFGTDATTSDTAGIHIDNFSADDAASSATLTPSLFTDTDTFHSATVSPGAVSLAPSLFADSDAFYSPAVTPGSINLTPSLFVDSDYFFAPSVAAGAVNLAPALFADTDTFYSSAVTPGAITLAPSLYVDADTFHAATVAAGGSLFPAAFTDADVFYSPSVTAGSVNLGVALFTDADSFYAPTVAPGAIGLTPSLFADSDAFYSAEITQGFALLPALFSDSDTFYSPSVAVGLVTLAPSLFADDDTFYAPTVAAIGSWVGDTVRFTSAIRQQVNFTSVI